MARWTSRRRRVGGALEGTTAPWWRRHVGGRITALAASWYWRQPPVVMTSARRQEFAGHMGHACAAPTAHWWGSSRRDDAIRAWCRTAARCIAARCAMTPVRPRGRTTHWRWPCRDRGAPRWIGAVPRVMRLRRHVRGNMGAVMALCWRDARRGIGATAPRCRQERRRGDGVTAEARHRQLGARCARTP